MYLLHLCVCVHVCLYHSFSFPSRDNVCGVRALAERGTSNVYVHIRNASTCSVLILFSDRGSYV